MLKEILVKDFNKFMDRPVSSVLAWSRMFEYLSLLYDRIDVLERERGDRERSSLSSLSLPPLSPAPPSSHSAYHLLFAERHQMCEGFSSPVVSTGSLAGKFSLPCLHL